MNKIDIPFIMWSGRKVGVALHKLTDGENEIKVTAKNVKGEFLYPQSFIINKAEAIKKHGVTTINKNNLLGVWLPLNDYITGAYRNEDK